MYRTVAISILPGTLTACGSYSSPAPSPSPMPSRMSMLSSAAIAVVSGMWNSGTMQPGARFSFTFRSAGTFPYHCAIHPNMVGTLVVR